MVGRTARVSAAVARSFARRSEWFRGGRLFDCEFDCWDWGGCEGDCEGEGDGDWPGRGKKDVIIIWSIMLARANIGRDFRKDGSVSWFARMLEDAF